MGYSSSARLGRPIDRVADPGRGREQKLMVATGTEACVHPGHVTVPTHRVTFFEDERDLTADLAAAFHAHLSAGGSAIVIATQTHRHALSVVLEGRGLSTRSMEREGRYVALDAATTLAGLLDGGKPDPAHFAAIVGGLVQRLLAVPDQPLLAYGEMVGLLWDRGDVTGAIALEDLWNELASAHSFGLLCGYRRSCLDS